MYYLYILKSNKDGDHYIGITFDLQRRLRYHNGGQVRSTKGRIPFKMIYSEKFDSRIEARAREVYL